MTINTHKLYKVEIFARNIYNDSYSLILDTEYYTRRDDYPNCGNIGEYFIDMIKKYTKCKIINRSFIIYESNIHEGITTMSSCHEVKTDEYGNVKFVHIDLPKYRLPKIC